MNNRAATILQLLSLFSKSSISISRERNSFLDFLFGMEAGYKFTSIKRMSRKIIVVHLFARF